MDEWQLLKNLVWFLFKALVGLIGLPSALYNLNIVQVLLFKSKAQF